MRAHSLVLYESGRSDRTCLLAQQPIKESYCQVAKYRSCLHLSVSGCHFGSSVAPCDAHATRHSPLLIIMINMMFRCSCKPVS